MKVVVRLINLLAALCIEKYCHFFSARRIVAKAAPGGEDPSKDATRQELDGDRGTRNP
ncbi:hypothetical protein ACVWZM_001717 [Bradyrhizobium sp. USDA 4501]